MTATDPELDLITTSGHLPHDERLRVDGVIPAGLEGAFVQTVPHPGASCRPAGPGPQRDSALLSGVRLGAAAARRLHAPTGEFACPIPGAALWARPAGSADPRPEGPGRASVALPVEDRLTRQWHTVATYPGLDRAEHLVIGPDGAVLGSRPFALDGAPLMHAVALTERFVVVFDLPVTYRRAAAMVGGRLPYRWQHGRPARIGLLPRWPGDAQEARWFPIDPCYVFQSVNAYDDGDRVVVDAVRHDRAFDASPWGGDGAAGSPRVHRWTLDTASGAVCERPLVDSVALASVDTRRAGLRHQLVFGCAPGGRALVGHDLAADSSRVRRLAPGWRAGLPVFVPRGRVEGDGWIVVLTQNAAQRRGELLVLDAFDLTGRPQAVVHLPGTLPAVRHTDWVPASGGHAHGR
ncbi:carotenoid oxygenase family protein [Streptosporangium sp. CA-135522]|uniref:carotenoid oxygenase family protein n=1 Tax=Streptosporangium sp. CA-135522 TaxID=3240072 RepID=UPI003D94A2C6